MSRSFGRAVTALSLLALFFLTTASPVAHPPSGAQRRTPTRPRRPPDARQSADAAQASGIRRLRAASAVAPRLKLERGAVRFATLDVRVPARAGADADARAAWFVAEHRDLLRVKNPAADLQLTRRSPDGQFVFFRRRHLGIPVFPGGIGVHLRGSSVRALSGNYVADEIDAGPVPRLTAAQAEQAARRYDRRSRAVLGDTSLRYVNLGLLGAGDDRTRLAWRVNLDTHKTVYVDAQTGGRLYTSSRERSDFDLELDNSNGNGPREGAPCGGEERWFEEGGPVPGADPDDEGRLAFASVTAVDSYFRNTFGRDGYDGDGDDIEVYVHVGSGWRNAKYLGGWCDIFEFGDSYPVNDVMGHEFTHGVNDNEGELEYANQSGALDESFADIFGHFVDDGDWLVGEDTLGAGAPDAGRAACVATRSLRDMSDPPCRFQPDRYNSPLRHAYSDNPDRDLNDFGGVHTNSGINNKAAFLITDGGMFNSRLIRGLGRAKAQRLFYAVLTSYLWDSAQMIDARNGAVFFALLWSGTGTHGFTADDLCQVRNAYAAVELGQGDSNCDGVEDGAPSDFDEDASSDGNDNCPDVSNPGQWDWDNDGLGNECDPDDDNDGRNDEVDNCPGIHNPGQQDLDSDGEGDVCDNSDAPGDWQLDSEDNCPLHANPDQKDTDGDRQGDVCDANDDNDAFPDASDNCPLTASNSQADGDNDRIGDACDLCPGVRSPDNGDPDGDGAGNPCDADDDNDGRNDGADNCPLVPNPAQTDLDGDGVGFACDADERGSVYDTIKSARTVNAKETFVTPVPSCPQCGGAIPNNHEEVVIVEAPAGFDVRVVDSEGRSVADGSRRASRHVLRFRPPPHGGSAARAGAVRVGAVRAQPPGGAPHFGGGASVQRRLPLDKPAPDELRYYLVVTPAPRAAAGRDYRVSFEFDRGLRAPSRRPGGRRPTPTPGRPR
jgi:hypothetical protein